ncbi:MAG: 16S rRNA (guanine(527)-N(7))-methyltransferase RsmG [Chlorobium sp.]|nr:16S rRNA (guanine(527)-N(7))-methyltransferase RsmG [Chlorobium phaeovibrioides]NQU46336.1 16S rRNA (guanine(527)-N(7))-methyltransferase RsmG [Chlorobium sp.]
MKQQSNDGDLLNSFCTKEGIQITDEQHELLIRYSQLLGQWNTKVNLISRKEDAPILIRHVFHSLLPSLVHSFRDGETVLDLGTGGGLPGIPLAIIFPNVQFLLVDSTGKKINACTAMIQELGLTNARAMHTRVEELKGLAFNTILSRQVAPLRELSRYAARLLKKDGELICLKGGDLQKEIDEALREGKKGIGFPGSITLKPIGEVSPLFNEKQIVIARWR